MVDIYRVFYPTTRKYIFFSAVHETFSKIGHILLHKASLNKFKKIISDYNRIKLGVNKKRNHRKYSNTWRLNIILLKSQWVTKEIREEITKTSWNPINLPESLGYRKGKAKENGHSF
jgi:hypothetical protein